MLVTAHHVYVAKRPPAFSTTTTIKHMFPITKLRSLGVDGNGVVALTYESQPGVTASVRLHTPLAPDLIAVDYLTHT